MTADLFTETPTAPMPAGVFFKPGFLASRRQIQLLSALRDVVAGAPLARARTPMGGQTSAAMTNCGAVGWWSDTTGYRYQSNCPGTGQSWPEMPAMFRAVVTEAVADTPWQGFAPDACLINFYGPGARMGLHQDKDERDFTQPIVTVCLGDDADFLVGGAKRSDPTRAVIVRSGDVLIFGGESRMRFHGIRKIYPDSGTIEGIGGRFSLTFRKAL